MNIIKEAKKRYETARSVWADNQRLAEEDIRFARMSEQWPEKVKQDREAEGRPCLTFNRLPTIIRQVVNDARINTPSIVVHPVDDDSDPDTAEVVNGLIRNIQESSNAELAYDGALENAVTGGFGFFRVELDYATADAFDLDIKIDRIANQSSVIPYPHSTAADASDWLYCFVVDSMSNDEFEAAYPDAEKVDWQSEDDWFDEDQVRVCEYWTREEKDVTLYMLANGSVVTQDDFEANPVLSTIPVLKTREGKKYVVTQYIINGREVLEQNDWPGCMIPIIPVYGDEIWIDGKRHLKSLTRDAMDAQRNYNFQRSAYTEHTGLSTKAPWIGPVGAFDTDIGKWQTANRQAHPFIEYDGPMPPQQVQPRMPDGGLLQDSINAAQDIMQITGIHEASLGMRSNEQSGRAIIARQREGDVSTFHFIDNLSRAIRYAGRVILDLIPHVYDTPRVLRVLGMDGEPQKVQVNQEFVQGQVAKLHDLTKGKYDLVVKSGPSFSTKREEAANQMVELLRSFPQAAPYIGDLLAKNLDWPGADKIAKRLKLILPPEVQKLEKLDELPPEAQAAVAQAQAQIDQLSKTIEMGKQMLAEKDQLIKQYEVEKRSKDKELQIKQLESDRDYDVALKKIQADMAKAQGSLTEEQRKTIINLVTDLMDRVEDEGEEYGNVVSY